MSGRPSLNVLESLSPEASRLYADADKDSTYRIKYHFKWNPTKYKDIPNIKPFIRELANKGLLINQYTYDPPPTLSGMIKCIGERCGINMGPKLIGYANSFSRKNSRKHSRKNSRKNTRKNNRRK
jgi:hypothetical protein